jgi:hypothetical protein
LAVKTRTIRTLAWVCLGVVAFYAVLYCIDSSLGGYWAKPEMDGRDRYSFGLAMPTALLWQPRWGHKALGQTDLLGMAYAPLIWLDRRCVHSTIYLTDDNGLQRASHLARAQIHPDSQDMYDTYHTNSQPDGASNRSQPTRPETNRASAAAGSGR